MCCEPGVLILIMTSRYNPLDDTPHQIRARLQNSPHPSHYSIITDASPQPLSPNLQQVMSPSVPNVLLSTSPSQAAAEPQQQSSATAVQATRMHVDETSVAWQSITQLSLPLDQLRDLQATVTLDQGVLEDVQAALVELSSRIHHRTKLLGDVLRSVGGATHKLQEGCIALESQVAQMNKVLMEQKDALERAHQQHLHEFQDLRHCNQKHAGNIRSLQRSVLDMHEEHSSDIRIVRDRLEQVQAEQTRQQATMLDANLQQEAMLSAKLESLETRVHQLEENNIVLRKALGDQKARADEHETILYAQKPEGSTEESFLGPAVQALSERVDRELARLADQHQELASQHKHLESVTASGDALKAEVEGIHNIVEQVCERFDAFESAQGYWPEHPPGLQTEPLGHNAHTYQMSPDGDQAEYVVDDPWMAWHQGPSAQLPVITEPPTLAPHLRKAEEPAREDESHEPREIPANRWKILLEVPRLICPRVNRGR